MFLRMNRGYTEPFSIKDMPIAVPHAFQSASVVAMIRFSSMLTPRCASMARGKSSSDHTIRGIHQDEKRTLFVIC